MKLPWYSPGSKSLRVGFLTSNVPIDVDNLAVLKGPRLPSMTCTVKVPERLMDMVSLQNKRDTGHGQVSRGEEKNRNKPSVTDGSIDIIQIGDLQNTKA